MEESSERFRPRLAQPKPRLAAGTVTDLEPEGRVLGALARKLDPGLGGVDHHHHRRRRDEHLTVTQKPPKKFAFRQWLAPGGRDQKVFAHARTS